MDKKNLIRNFSRYAYLYDSYAELQRRSAIELLGQIPKNSFNTILEIGCGTGNYTLILREAFRTSRLLAVDISERMIEVAQDKLKGKKIEFIVADGEVIDLVGTFDLITSNAALQWFGELERALLKYKGLLNKDGIISFSIFGPSTFQELNTAINCLLKDVTIEAANFESFGKIKNILNKNFREAKVEEIKYEECYSGLKQLLNKIKYSGIRGDGFGKGAYCGSKFFRKLEEAYLDKFKQIKASYQIFFCRGIK